MPLYVISYTYITYFCILTIYILQKLWNALSEVVSSGFYVPQHLLVLLHVNQLLLGQHRYTRTIGCGMFRMEESLKVIESKPLF